MITVWKYPISYDKTVISAPQPHKFLHFDIQNNMPTIWVQVNTEMPKTDRAYVIVRTGHPLPHPWSIYRATIRSGIFVWHLWEVPV